MKNGVLIIGKIRSRLQLTLNNRIEALVENPSQIHDLSDSKRDYGGMGLEVATGLAVLGTSPILVSAVGRDFDYLFQDYLNDYNIQCKAFRNKEKESSILIEIRDKQGKKIYLNQENAYLYLAENNLSDVMDINTATNLIGAFIATGKVEADIKFISDVYESNPRIPIIHSPDENINELTKWRLEQVFEKISILVCSEAELQKIESNMNIDRKDILSTENYSRLKYIVSLEHRDRTIIYSKSKMVKISAAPADEVLSETGWKNAFRAGLIYGILNKKPIEEAAKLGAALASYAVETREYFPFYPSIEQVSLRSFEVKAIDKKYN
ncbi:MAG: hypothetical protein EAX86_13400 [Candidatus Heimdallarchaeota archaeon]|nr:hypothetical protein [Candidatus Heimdallarchaeota archaeon]